MGQQELTDELRPTGKSGGVGVFVRFYVVQYLRRATALTNDSATLSFRGPTPDAVALATGKCVLEAGDADIALSEDFLGDLGLVVVLWKKDGRIKTVTGPP